MNRRELCRALGAAVASPALSRLPADELWMAGRRAHRAVRARGFTVLDAHQAETVAVLVDMIIPDTDTPGARAAGVPQFIDLLLAEWVTEAERAPVMAGLADLDARSRKAFGADFVAGNETQRADVLRALEADERAAPQGAAAGMPPFFASMKWVTAYGYFTSEVGAKQELHYETVPGAFDGCTDLGAARAAPGDF